MVKYEAIEFPVALSLFTEKEWWTTLRRRRPSKDLTERLATDIRAGVFSPGSWLKQIDLQRRYHANRSEIRKALETLSSKRLIRYEQNRGYYVHEPDGDATDEIRDIRIMLETSAAELMVRQVNEAQIDALYALAQRFIDQLRDHRIIDIYETNIAFHTALLATAGNASLVDLVSELRLRTPPATRLPMGQLCAHRTIRQGAFRHGRCFGKAGFGNPEGNHPCPYRSIQHAVLDPCHPWKA